MWFDSGKLAAHDPSIQLQRPVADAIGITHQLMLQLLLLLDSEASIILVAIS